MKNEKYLPLLLTLALLLVPAVSSLSEPVDRVYFQGVQVAQVLRLYEEFTGQQLIVSSNAKRCPNAIVLRVGPDVSKADTIKLMERALLEQAGIVVTKLDEKRTSITYNDALPIIVGTPVRESSPQPPTGSNKVSSVRQGP